MMQELFALEAEIERLSVRFSEVQKANTYLRQALENVTNERDHALKLLSDAEYELTREQEERG